MDQDLHDVRIAAEKNTPSPETLQMHENAINNLAVLDEQEPVENTQSSNKKGHAVQVSVDTSTGHLNNETSDAILAEPSKISQHERTESQTLPTEEIAGADNPDIAGQPHDSIEQPAFADASTEVPEYIETEASPEDTIELHTLPVQAENLISSIAEMDNPPEESLITGIESYLEHMGHDIDLATEELLPPISHFVEISNEIRLTYASEETIKLKDLVELVEATRELLAALGTDTSEEAILSVIRRILPETCIAEYLEEIAALTRDNGTYEFNQWNLPGNIGPSKKFPNLHIIGRMALGLQTT